MAHISIPANLSTMLCRPRLPFRRISIDRVRQCRSVILSCNSWFFHFIGRLSGIIIIIRSTSTCSGIFSGQVHLVRAEDTATGFFQAGQRVVIWLIRAHCGGIFDARLISLVIE